MAVREGLMPSAGGALRLEEVVDMHLAPWLQAQPSRSMLPALSAADVAEGLQRFGETVRLRAGEELYAAGDDASAMYIVLSGEIMCEWDFDAFTRCAVAPAAQPQTNCSRALGLLLGGCWICPAARVFLVYPARDCSIRPS